MRIEIPDQREGIDRSAIRGIRRLKNHEDRNRVDGILESSAKEARAMRRRDDPAVAKARRPNPSVLRDPIRSVSSGRPQFDLVPARFRSILCAQRRSEAGQKQSARKDQHSNGLHRRGSPRSKYIFHEVWNDTGTRANTQTRFEPLLTWTFS